MKSPYLESLQTQKVDGYSTLARALGSQNPVVNVFGMVTAGIPGAYYPPLANQTVPEPEGKY